MTVTHKIESPLTTLLRRGPVVFKGQMTREEFHRFSLRHDELRMERDKNGIITIQPFMTYDSGFNEGEAFFALKLWSKKYPHLGKVLSPSTSFDLPDGSTHKADGAWVSMQKHNSLTEEERKHIAAIVPDFVMEVRSQTDSLRKLKRKMEDVWIANGVRLAWLIDPINEKAWVFRANGLNEEIRNFSGTLDGEDVLPGFVLKLQEFKEQ
ncbi:MAG: Uma2 family endonuclease [Saprospiraceae bacterium]|nr:MAG: Uma2 family endonuclease [Saprospiraceae bacterium]